MSVYIIIPRLEVNNVNVQPASWLVTAPPITAYLGFAHKFALAVKELNHEGIAIVHHHLNFLGEENYSYGVKTLAPHQYRSASLIDADDYSSKNQHALSGQPTARGRMCCSLVIRLADTASVTLSDVPKFLRGGRLAGGNIVDHGKVLFATESEFEDKFSVVRSGFAIASREDLMQVTSEIESSPYRLHNSQPADMLDVFLHHTRRVEFSNESKAWLHPTSIGYREASARAHRKKVRGDFPHAYAEPLISLIEYRSLRDERMHFSKHFWQYTHPDAKTYLARTHQFISKEI